MESVSPSAVFVTEKIPPAATRLAFDSDGAFGQEPYTFRESPITVQWIAPTATIRHLHDGEPTTRRLAIALGTIKPHMTLRLYVNGKRTRREFVVHEQLWVDGCCEAVWDVDLVTGENVFELRTDSAAVALPGGREVAFLVAGAPLLYDA